MNRFGRILAIGAALAPGIAPAAHPGFDCARATSQIIRLICADPELSALDRKLNLDFRAIQHQGGVDAAKLATDQDRWRRDIRDACYDRPCIARVYRARDAEILTMSRKAASPASFPQTQAFAVPPPLWAQARAFVGRNCATVFKGRSRFFTGFSAPRGFLPITLNGGVVEPRQKDGVRFAFLLQTPGATIASCRVTDVVALPPPARDDAFLECGGRSADLLGFVVRRKSAPPAESFWSVDEANGHLEREAPAVLGGIACHQPETGD